MVFSPGGESRNSRILVKEQTVATISSTLQRGCMYSRDLYRGILIPRNVSILETTGTVPNTRDQRRCRLSSVASTRRSPTPLGSPPFSGTSPNICVFFAVKCGCCLDICCGEELWKLPCNNRKRDQCPHQVGMECPHLTVHRKAPMKGLIGPWQERIPCATDGPRVLATDTDLSSLILGCGVGVGAGVGVVQSRGNEPGVRAGVGVDQTASTPIPERFIGICDIICICRGDPHVHFGNNLHRNRF